MNTLNSFCRITLRGTQTTLASCLSPALATVVLCLGFGTLLLTARLQFERSDPLPPGQFKADMRSLLAAIRYLAEPESDDRPESAPGAEYTAGLQANGQPPANCGYPSNQIERPHACATLPARS